MSIDRIAFCGSPYVGKTSIQERFRLFGTNSLIKCERTPDAFLTHRITMEGSEVMFQWLGGPVFDTHKLYPQVFEGVGLVIHVTTTTEPIGVRYQEDYLEAYMDTASDLGKTWNHIPWLFVLNKIDLGMRNPLLHRVPENQRGEIIQCCALDGRGVETLWKRILNRHSLPAIKQPQH